MWKNAKEMNLQIHRMFADSHKVTITLITAISTLSSDFSDNFYSSFGSWTIIPSPGDVNTDARYFTCANKYIGLFMKNEGVQKSFSLGLTIRYIRLRA